MLRNLSDIANVSARPGCAYVAFREALDVHQQDRSVSAAVDGELGEL
jgi:hypothetical protein